jgi:hypothetical protein
MGRKIENKKTYFFIYISVMFGIMIERTIRVFAYLFYGGIILSIVCFIGGVYFGPAIIACL